MNKRVIQALAGAAAVAVALAGCSSGGNSGDNNSADKQPYVALDRQQGQAVLRGRFAQLLEAEALLLEALQELEPRVAVARPVEQSLGLEVDRHAHIVP